MAKFMEQLPEALQRFIENQKIFFVATAAADGRINLSPKGLDALRIISPTEVVWLNLTGSGNETAAHLLAVNRITLMFCSFDEKPLILRLYGRAEVIHQNDSEWNKYYSMFPNTPGARQVFKMHIESLQTSCGFGVPLLEFTGHRDQLNKWAEAKGEEVLIAYQREKNAISIDGLETGLPT